MVSRGMVGKQDGGQGHGRQTGIQDGGKGHRLRGVVKVSIQMLSMNMRREVESTK